MAVPTLPYGRGSGDGIRYARSRDRKGAEAGNEVAWTLF